MKDEKSEVKVRQKAEMILKVQAGLMSASEAAKQLGVSRKTYYKWEKRALSGMMEGLCERSSGRPSKPCDTEKETLKKEAHTLKKELAANQERQQLRDLLRSESKKKG